MLDRWLLELLGEDAGADARMVVDGGGGRNSADHRGGGDDVVAGSGALPTEEATPGICPRA
jgi:hypothetical protein